MKPYYEDESCTIYHGDCRDFLPLDVDAVVTDPPYGIGADKRQGERANKRHGRAVAPSKDYGAVTEWDSAVPDKALLDALLASGRFHIVWGGNYFTLPPSSGWLVWDKETGANGYADCELAWTDIPMAVRKFRFQWMGMLQQIPELRLHPTQKPTPVMRWCLSHLPKGVNTILDPFMGSGSTLRAAKDMGFSAVGIDAEERYCEIAAQRLAQEVLAI